MHNPDGDGCRTGRLRCSCRPRSVKLITLLLLPLGLFTSVQAYWIWPLFTLILYGSSVAVISRLDPARGRPLRLAMAVAYAALVFYWLIVTGQTTGVAVLLWTVAFVLGRLPFNPIPPMLY